MKKIVISSFVAVVAVFALLGPAAASTISNAVDAAVSAVNMQIDTISIDVAHCGSCGSDAKHEVKTACGCNDKCGCSKPKCGCKDKCGSKCGDKCGCSKPKCGCKDKCGSKCGDKCGCSKPKCCDKPKCGCEKKCGCKDKCCKSECCPKHVENYPDANRGAEGEWARDGLSRQRA